MSANTWALAYPLFLAIEGVALFIHNDVFIN